MPRLRPKRPTLSATTALLVAYPLGVTALSAVNVAFPQRSGPLAISEILAPHLLLPLVLLVPLAARRGARFARIALVVAAVVGVARFGPGVVSLPASPPPGATTVRFLSWNLETGLPPAADVVRLLAASDADIVALQELTPEHAAAIEADTATASRFGYRALFPVAGAAGVGLLSRFPLDAVAHSMSPLVVQATVRLPGGEVVTIIDAHPFPGRITTVTDFRVPVGFDPGDRDAGIRSIRSLIDAALARHERLAVVGDFNVSDREPAYNDLAKGLLDAQREVGQGTGSTWRPDRMKFLPFGVLRIDYLFAGGGIVPTEISEDCTPRGTDHCVVRAAVAVPPKSAP
jgi:vancomycin resistance protein VanJ